MWTRPKKILVPVDFSELATAALHYAVHIAERSHASITVLNADPFDAPVEFMATELGTVAESIEVAYQHAREELRRYAESNIPTNIKHDTAVVKGLAVSSIVHWAEDHNIDLIVMGTHGRGGLQRVLLGSVTESVVRSTTRPVLSFRPTDEPSADRPIRKILCPINFTEVAHEALDYATVVADVTAADLTLVHVLEEKEADAAEAMRQVDKWIPWLRETATTTVARMVRHGDPADEIIELARTGGYDLIVIGAQHKLFGDATLLGTTTARLTRHAPCPVLTVLKPAKEAPATNRPTRGLPARA